MTEQVLWTIEALTEATGGELSGAVTVPLNGISIDSRTLSPGDIFVAIKGDQFDGHTFVDAALEAGAGVAVVQHGTSATSHGPLLAVDDPLRALEDMARAARARCTGKVIAVTGSVGKTGTKDALRLALSHDAQVHASAASYNNHWGVPLSLARFPETADFGVFEVGMNHSGEITPLSRMIRPDVAIITTVEAVHLGHFSSIDEIADAKAEVFAGLEPEGTAILNRDNPFFDRLSEAAKAAGVGTIIGFGEHEDADARLTKVVLHGTCSCVSATICGHDITYKLGVPGRHIVINSLAVLAAVAAVDGDIALAAFRLARMAPPKGRGLRHALSVDDGYFTLVDESYNANPASMRAALATVGHTRPGPRGRRIAVLGDMLELGSDAERLHAELADAVDDASIDLVYACGPNMLHLWDAMPDARRGVYADSSEDLKGVLSDALRKGDVVVIKGSLGSRMGPLVETLRERFSPAIDNEQDR